MQVCRMRRMYVLLHTISQLWFCWHGDGWASSGRALAFSMLFRALQMHIWRKSCSKRQYNCMGHGDPFYPSVNIATNQASDSVHCSMRWILLLLEELSNKSCAVHMSSGMVTHIRVTQQGATHAYDPVISLEGYVNYTTLIFMNSKKHDYSSLLLPIFQHIVLHAKLALGHH